MKKIVVLNHKMSLMYDELYNYIERLNNIDTDNNIIVCPSNIYLEAFMNNCEWSVGAQNMHYSTDEMHTGEISSMQIKSLGTEYVMVGHYDRVNEFKESVHIVNQKLLGCLDSNIFPILFFGEDIDEDYRIVIPKLLDGYLRDVSNIEFIVFAYEPIYAIGTGALPNIDKIKEVTGFIRKYLEDKFNSRATLLYGGSVCSTNVSDVINIDTIDGVVVGNISSDIREVEKIFKNV